jgi:hypothetical protein
LAPDLLGSAPFKPHRDIFEVDLEGTKRMPLRTHANRGAQPPRKVGREGRVNTAPFSQLAVTSDGENGHCLRMPAPLPALRHALGIVFEGILAPLALFYIFLVTVGFRAALIAALCWSYVALIRRLRRHERSSMLLILGTMLLTARTVVAFVTGSAFVYFAQPMAGTVIIAFALIGSALVGKPFTERFANDFCPVAPELLARPLVRRFFIRISWLWATVLLINVGVVLWLLLSASLHAFVLERSAVTYTLTGGAIFFSINRFIAMMRRDGISVHWGPSVDLEPLVAP